MSRIELRASRWVLVPFLIGDIVPLTVFYRVFTDHSFANSGDAFSQPVETPLGMKLALGFFTAIGVFMFFVFLYRIIKNPVVVGSLTGRGGPRLMPAVALILNDPDAYIAKFPKVMSPLFKFREGEADTPLLLEPEMFGKRYAEIVQRMKDEVSRANATR